MLKLTSQLSRIEMNIQSLTNTDQPITDSAAYADEQRALMQRRQRFNRQMDDANALQKSIHRRNEQLVRVSRG
jgi:hypothetical protein